MKSGRKLYQRLCWAPDLEAAVAKLSRKELRGLHDYLATTGAKRGVPALIAALLLNEAAGRALGVNAEKLKTES